MRFVPESVHATLLAIAAKHHLPTAPGVVAKALAELSRDYNAHGATRSRPEILAARLLFSLPRDVPKGAAAVRELLATKRLGGRPTLRVLDLGAGLGATTLGLACALERGGWSGAIDALLVDADGEALALAADAIAQWPLGRVTVAARTVRASLPLAASDPRIGGPWDAIVLGQVLSELDRDVADEARATAHARWIESITDSLADDGSLVVIEPALRERTRHLHRVREHVRARVYAPCLHHKTCPMLARDGDWCHEDRAIDLPAFAEPLARAAGLRWQGLTFSYLVLRRDGATLAADLGGTDLHRIVENPRVTKGKRELALCAGATLTRATRLDRDASKHDVLTRATRGDVVRIAFGAPVSGASVRIDAAQNAAASLPVDALTLKP